MKKTLRAWQVTAARPPPSRAKHQSVDKRAKAQNSCSGKTSRHRTPENIQHILDSAGVAMLALDRDLKLRFFTRAATALFKVTASDLSRPLSKVTCRFEGGNLILDAQAVVATGVSLVREINTDNGACYNQRILPHRNGDNDIQGVVITFADISEMKVVEQEIEAARTYSDSIIDTIRQSLVVLDHELRVVSASPSFYRSFAIKPGSAVGQELPNLLDRCLDVPALRSFLDRIAAGRDVVDDCEIEIELPPRGQRVLLLNASKISAVSPAKTKTLLAIDDVTDRKHAEVALETAKKHAEQANLGKSRFLAAASHDLRQPLQSLTLLQGVLAAQAKTSDDSNLSARLGESLDAMSAMLNTMLDINQLEAGIIKPAPTNFTINALFERLRSEFTDQAKNKGLRFRVVSSHHSVRSDPTLFEQIIRNLISNAFKYTNQGEVLLGCRRRGRQLQIQVWDTGIGIPKGQIRAVFDEFHQLDNPARERARGLGLGLSIVQRLANLLGHTVDVRSRPGEGSVFSINVPYVDAESRETPPAQPRQTASRLGEGDSILVVEDDPAIREVLQLLFETNGYATTAVADGNRALELVAHGGVRPNIVCADYNLPKGLTGLEIAARLREMLDSALPVLIVTGDISIATLRAIADAGCVQLNKPIKADELIRHVRSQLAAPRQTSEPRRRPRPTVGGAEEQQPTVFLIDDDDALREAMCDLIARAGRPVEAFASSEAFLEAYRPGCKGCLLVDARLPGLSGLALLQRLKADHCNLPSIMITGHGEISMAVEAMKAGANDFVEKPVDCDELLASIDRAIELTRNSTAVSALRETAAARIAGLTPRERQVMDFVVIGRPNKIIAADLRVSQRTIENHRAAVMKKTASKSLSDLVRLAVTVA
jgi:two-component system CheB/CheR fusion protein